MLRQIWSRCPEVAASRRLAVRGPNKAYPTTLLKRPVEPKVNSSSIDHMSFGRFSLLVCFAMILLCACSKQADAPTKTADASVRGEPIRGEPIRSEKAAEKKISIPSITNGILAKADAVKACDAPLPKRILEKPEYIPATFDVLSSYSFEVPDGIIPTNEVGKTEGQIPREVKAFDKQKVVLKGFMLPLKVDNGLVTEMLIMKDQSMCCYGAVPRINDWVSVKMKSSNGVKSIMDQPVTLYGKLHVGEMLENGYLVGIYEMEGEKMDEPKN